MNQPYPRLCIHCGIPEKMVATVAVPKEKCNHGYSKQMNQPYPRLCIYCRQPEKVKVV